MFIQTSIVNAIIVSPKIRIEYSGTHNSDPKNPLYGRRAYWRLYLEGYGFVCKVTAPVRSINPKQSTLNKLLVTTLKERLSAIDYVVGLNPYGEISKPYKIDPYSCEKLLDAVTGEYIDLLNKKDVSL